MKYLLLLLLLSCVAKKSNKVEVKDIEVKETEVLNTSNDTLPLYERGWSKEIREGYIENLGKGFYPTAISEAFKEGRVFYGMEKDMIEKLYGQPNKVIDSSWIYTISNKKVLEIEFKEDKITVINYSY